MMSCREVAGELSAGTVGNRPLGGRAAVWVHVAMCRRCRAFREQLRHLAVLVRAQAAVAADEPAPTFEHRIVGRLTR